MCNDINNLSLTTKRLEKKKCEEVHVALVQLMSLVQKSAKAHVFTISIS